MQTEKVDKTNREWLGGLTYLELCMIPRVVKPYLQSQDVSELKDSFYLHLQTFLELNPQALKRDGESFYINQNLCKNRILVGQMMNLFKNYLKFTIEKNFFLQTILINFDRNFDKNQYKLIKVIVEKYLKREKMQTNKRYLRIILEIVGLNWEIHLTKLGFSKTEIIKEFSQDLGLRKKKLIFISKEIQDFKKEIQNLSEMKNEKLFQRYNHIIQFSQQIIEEYGYIFSSDKIANNKSNFIEEVQIQQKMVSQNQKSNLNPEHLSPQINNFYFSFSSINEKQCFVTKLLYRIVSNKKQFDQKESLKVNNMIIILLEQISFKQPENIGFFNPIKSNLYSMILILKIVSNFRQGRQEEDWLSFSTNIAINFKEILDFRLCSMEVVWIFLSSFASLAFQDDRVLDILLELINFVMDIYSKQPISNQCQLFPESTVILNQIIKVKVMLIKKQSLEEEIQKKQIEILDLINQKIVKYKEKFSWCFLELLDIQILQYLVNCLVKFRRIEKNFIVNQYQHIDYLTLNGMINTLYSPKKQKFEDYLKLSFSRICQKAQNVQNTTNDKNYQETIIEVLTEKLVKDKDLLLDETKSQLIFLQYYSLEKYIYCRASDTGYFGKVMSKIKEILGITLELISKKINNLLIEVANVPFKIKKQSQVQNINPEKSQLKQRFQREIESLALFVSFLYLNCFAVNPVANKMCYFHSIMWNHSINSPISEDKIEQIYRLTLKNKEILWNKFSQFEMYLKLSTKYDFLEYFYENLFKTSNYINEFKKKEITQEYSHFCNQWSQEEDNYQWLSEQKTFKIKLCKMRNYSDLLIKNDIY